MNNENVDSDIRIAAQSIYDHITTMNVRALQSPYDLARSHSINLITEEFLSGYMQDGRMSVVRRFFCLFVTFDLVFTALLWLISIMVTGENIYDALKTQVLQYTVYTSLFDVVAAAICRFLVLILFYAILHINHWIIIALSTTGSCLFLISKVFVFNWTISPQPVFNVVIIVTSFVLAWGEAWFFDCRVIPQERHARSYFSAIAVIQGTDRSSTTNAPFLSSDVTGAPQPDSIANFYSPYDSTHNSEDEDEVDEEYRKAGVECVRKAYELLESSDWKIEKVTKKNDTIQSTQREKLGKIYRLTARIKYPAKALLEELFYKIEDVPRWNPTLLESKIVRRIDNHTDISYQATIGGGGGLVKSRDFVNLRCWKTCCDGKVLQDDDEDDDNNDDDTTYNNDSCEGSVSSVYNEDDDDEDDENNYDGFNYNDNTPLVNDTLLNVKKSKSDTKIKNYESCSSSFGNSSKMPTVNVTTAATTTAFNTLSKSLGAKDFNTSNFYAEPPPLSNEYLDTKDSFDDNNKQQQQQQQEQQQQQQQLLLQQPQNKSGKSLKIYVSAAVSVPYQGIPKTSKYTRGENLLSCWAMREIEGKRDSCIFEWLLCLDLKGYIPKYVLDTAYTTLMQDYMKHLRRHCHELRQRRKRLKEVEVPGTDFRF